METWIRRACRQRAYRQLITWIILTIGVICIACSFTKYWNNFFHGPFPLTSSQLASTTGSIKDVEFASVIGTKVVSSGIGMITTETRNGRKEREYASSHFYVMVVGGRLLVVQSQSEPPLHAVGELQSLPSNLPRLMLPDDADSDLRSSIYPVLLNTTQTYRSSGYIFFGFTLVWCFLLWKFAMPAWEQTSDISKYPLVQKVEGWSNSIEVAALSEQQMSNGRLYGKGPFFLTNDFVIVKSFFRFELFLWNDLVWAYEKVTTRKLYFVLPISRSSEAVLVFYGGRVTLPGRKKRITELLKFASSRAPWAIFGHTSEIEEMFQKNGNEFSEIVETRRSQLTAM